MKEVDKTIVLNSVDSGEKNKKLTLFGINNGIFFATARGVKGQNAKLKFLNLPFVFCDIELLAGKNPAVIKTATIIKSYPEICQDLDKLNSACLCEQVLLVLMEKGVPDQDVFATFLACLENIATSENAILFSLKFVLDCLSLCGIGFNFEACNNCGEKAKLSFVNFSTGEFLCEKCADANCLQVKTKTIETINKILKNNFAEISNSDIKNSRAMLSQFFLCLYGKKPNLL